MGSVFSPDSKLIKLLGTVGDLLVLNVMYTVSCIPVVTIGAANTALYSVIFKLNTQREGSIWKDYWRSFRENFKQATGIWLILLGLFVVAAVDIYAGNAYGGFFLTVRPLFWLILVMTGLTYSMVFPTLSCFENTIWGTLKNGLLLSIANLPKSILLTVLHALPMALILWDLMTFLEWGALFATLYYAVVAGLGRVLLEKTYQRILETQEETAEA